MRCSATTDNFEYFFQIKQTQNSIMIAAKDAKSIACGDIDPDQRSRQSWKKKVSLDHTWTQARDNVVTLMTCLLVRSLLEEDMCFNLAGSLARPKQVTML